MKKQKVDFKNLASLVLSPIEDALYSITVDGREGRKSLIVNLEHPGVSCKIVCVYKTTGKETFDLAVNVTHTAPNTESIIKVRGVLYDKGVSNYRGQVIIRKTAVQSASKLENAVLVVGGGTHNYVEPTMQIETNDVAASHSSFTGRVDEEQLYYLQSRGLSREEASDLLVSAFLAECEIIDRC